MTSPVGKLLNVMGKDGTMLDWNVDEKEETFLWDSKNTIWFGAFLKLVLLKLNSTFIYSKGMHFKKECFIFISPYSSRSYPPSTQMFTVASPWSWRSWCLLSPSFFLFHIFRFLKKRNDFVMKLRNYSPMWIRDQSIFLTILLRILNKHFEHIFYFPSKTYVIGKTIRGEKDTADMFHICETADKSILTNKRPESSFSSIVEPRGDPSLFQDF